MAYKSRSQNGGRVDSIKIRTYNTTRYSAPMSVSAVEFDHDVSFRFRHKDENDSNEGMLHVHPAAMPTVCDAFQRACEKFRPLFEADRRLGIGVSVDERVAESNRIKIDNMQWGASFALQAAAFSPRGAEDAQLPAVPGVKIFVNSWKFFGTAPMDGPVGVANYPLYLDSVRPLELAMSAIAAARSLPAAQIGLAPEAKPATMPVRRSV